MKSAIVVAVMTGMALVPSMAAASPAMPSAPSAEQAATATLGARNGSGVAGVATLRWDSRTHVMTVTVDARGLAPKSSHPNHIHSGSCASPSMTIVYGLTPLVADGRGMAHATSTFHNVDTVMFGGGWFVCVHRGPTLSGTGAQSIACGDVM
jgi:hypothetical protein